MRIAKIGKLASIGLLAVAATACNDSDIPVNPNKGQGEANDTFTAAEWYPGGVLGTTTNEQGCYSNPSPFVESNGMYQSFKKERLSLRKTTQSTPCRVADSDRHGCARDASTATPTMVTASAWTNTAPTTRATATCS